ncbi:nra-2 [Pristionchus pacificus]|uniref:BOS complex subunit NCLN n=1 Tax=Pristionchus pacificus TaxID=54126 RepID=A0A2A6C4P3_PRIPA|nr:nra-2 [Pristionchus pacificus]|eukprot:PDM73192.1 nra-2 [Pristionchus pacificus]
MQEDLLEAFRTPLFFVYMSMLLSFCVVSSSQLGDRVELEFQAYRLQQYEVAGSVVGSKSFRVLYEAVGIDANALRKSVVVSWRDLVNRDLDSLFKTAVGSMIIILPADFSALSPDQRKLTSATTAIPASISYTPKNVIVRLAGGIPTASTIVFLAHYDTHSAFPDLGAGSDSNGSGMVALLELLSVFKRFYDSAATKPNNHMIFAWTAAGKHNYQGSATFLNEMQEKYADDKVDLVVCLDTIGNGMALNVHLSRVPSAGTTSDRFVTYLRAASHNQSIDVIAKKINMQLPFSWEHERSVIPFFSIITYAFRFNAKRQAALTLSGLSHPSEITRRSISDSSIDSTVLTSNIRTIAEATLSMILPLPERAAHKDERVTSDSTLLSPEAVSKTRVEQLDEGPPAWREADCFEQSACRQRTAGLPVSEGAPAALPREPRVVSSKINALVDEIANLSLLEVSDLNWALKKRLNIPDAPMISMTRRRSLSLRRSEIALPDSKKFVETAPCTMKEDMRRGPAGVEGGRLLRAVGVSVNGSASSSAPAAPLEKKRKHGAQMKEGRTANRRQKRGNLSTVSDPRVFFWGTSSAAAAGIAAMIMPGDIMGASGMFSRFFSAQFRRRAAPEEEQRALLRSRMSRFASHARPLSSQSATEETVANLHAYASSYGHARVQPLSALDTVVVPSNVERIVAEKTKPAIFDLFLAAGIAAYLAVFTKIVSSSQVLLDKSLITLRKGY